MIGYITLGTNDSGASQTFYDSFMACLGQKKKFAQDNGWAGYGLPETPHADVELLVCPPFNGEAATAGNGTMIAFRALTRDMVDSAFAAGMANGGSSEGEPGFRPPDVDHFYAAYLRDPVGKKLCVFCLV
jgi:hypothetical protein